MIIYPVHVVIRFDTCADYPPCFHRMFTVRQNRFIFLTSTDHSFAKLRKKHDSIRFRGTCIFQILFKERHRVDIVSRLRLEYIQMKMWSEWVSGIPTQRNPLSGFHRIFIGFGDDFYFPVLIFILKFLYPFGNGRQKSAQMAVDSGIAVVITDVKHIPRTIGDTYTWDIPVSKCPNRFADCSSRLKI